MPFMHKQQFSNWLSQPVVPSTGCFVGFVAHHASVEEEDKENAARWTASGLCRNNANCIKGYTTSLTTIYREEYNDSVFEASPTLSVMTALSCTSGHTVPIPKELIQGVEGEPEDDDLVKVMTACTDLAFYKHSDHSSSSAFTLDDRTSFMLLPKKSHARLSPPPRPAKRRSAEDLYSPATVRGAGYLKEGLCPLCSEAAWFKIKQSAYWYHMNFTHGISAMTGRPYETPAQYQINPLCNAVTCKSRGPPQPCKEVQVEGLCSRCDEWISIIVIPKHMSKIPFKTLDHYAWFKHAQKCHQRSQAKRSKRIKAEHVAASFVKT